MKLSAFIHPVLGCCLLLAGWACSHPPVPVQGSEKPTPSALVPLSATGAQAVLPVAVGEEPPFRLGPGDLIEVELLGLENTRRNCPVMPDGLVYFDLLPGLRARALTLPELKSLLEAELRRYYQNPQVALTLRKVRSQRVWVTGRVNTPGIYALDTPMTVVEAIARAGGLAVSRFSGTTEELADLRHSFIIREGSILPVDFHRLLVEGDTAQNLRLRNGDFIYLPSALSQEVYVLGAVMQPRTVGFKDRVTLVSAIAAARGLRAGAHSGNVLVIRGSLSQPQVFSANLSGILSGTLADVELQPRDIVWVADAPWSDLERYVKMVLNTFVRTVAANEGAHFAAPGSGTVPVTNPIGGQD